MPRRDLVRRNGVVRRFLVWLWSQPGRLRDWLDFVQEESLGPEEKFQRHKDVMTRHREEAVRAITRKNRLSLNLENTRGRLGEVRIEAAGAFEAGDRNTSHALMQELVDCDLMRAQLEELLRDAEAKVEQMKVALKAEEMVVRDRAEEMMVLRARRTRPRDFRRELEKARSKVAEFEVGATEAFQQGDLEAVQTCGRAKANWEAIRKELEDLYADPGFQAAVKRCDRKITAFVFRR